MTLGVVPVRTSVRFLRSKESATAASESTFPYGCVGRINVTPLDRPNSPLCLPHIGLVIDRSRVRIPAGAAEEFSSPGSTFCADSYFGIRSTPVLPHKHVKDPGHSAKSAGGRLQLNTHTPYVCGFA